MVNIDNVYQKVLAIANKEQRGYITPQEFNLFANQAQMEIFEQYFYDKNQYNRLPKDNTPYGDPVHLLEEKISIFKKRHKPVTIGNAFGDGTLPTDVYRLDNVLSYNTTDTTRIVEEITEDELVTYGQSPLAKPTTQRPVYLRTGETTIKIYPYGDGTNGAAIFFTVGGFDIDSGSSNITTDSSTANYSAIEVGQTVTQGNIPDDTFVGSVSSDGVVGLVDNNDVAVNATGDGDPVQVTFASRDIKCNYIRKPETVKWTYVVINDKAVHNSGATDLQNFELHESEEVELVIKILQLAGISMKDYQLASVASNKEVNIISQEKQ